MEKLKEKELLILIMEINTMGNGAMIKRKEMEYIILIMVQDMKVIL